MAADTGGTTVVSMLAMLVMARLIGPTDFGSAAIAVGLVQVANLYVEGLLHDALIQNRDVSEEAFDQGFWLATGLGAAMVAVAGAVWLLGRGGGAGRLELLIFAAALSLPFSGMTGVLNARLRREMSFRVVAAPSVSAKVVSSLVGLGAAWAGAGAWSLLAQFVSGAVIQAAGLMLASRRLPRFTGSVAALAPLWGFALPYAAMHTLVGLRIQGFTALTAALGGLAAAGYINVAFRLTLNPQILLTTALTNVGLPLLSREQHDREALGAAFDRFNRLNALGLPVAFLGVAATADLLVKVLLGAQWTPSITPMRIFAVGAAFYFLRMPSALLLRAVGQVRYSLLNAVMHLALTLGAMLWLRPADPVTAAVLWVAPLGPLVPLTLWIVKRETGITVLAQLRGTAAPLACALGMAAAVLAARHTLAGLSDAVTLAVCVALGAATYAGLVWLTDGGTRAWVGARSAALWPRRVRVGGP